MLGTFVEIEADDRAAVELGFDVVAEIHRQMSAHDPRSDLSQVNRAAHLGPVAVGDWTALAIIRATDWARRSNGQFDAVRAGHNAVQMGDLPLHADQSRPDPTANWRTVSVSADGVRLAAPACLDLGGIAKGLAVDLAVEAMRAAGATAGLVNAGGDLRGFGPDPWPITVVEPETRQPVAQVDVLDGALATSAALPGPDGLQFGHLPNGNKDWVSVTVRAATACDADALAKIVWAMGANSASLLKSAGAEAFAIRRDGGIAAVETRSRAA